MLGSALCWSLLLPGLDRSDAQVASDEDQIRAVRAAFNEAIARHDVPGLLGFLEEDLHVATSGGTFLENRREMADAFAARFAEHPDTVYERTPEKVEVGASGEVASEMGHWLGTWTASEGPVRTGGRYAASWRRTEGRWRLHAELYVALFCEGPGCP